MADIDQIKDVAATEAINRAAFPAYKVYMYGRDVSADVIAIRPNQAGGSLERTPSTCAITLQNQQEKYVLNHKDIIRIGIEKNKLDSSWSSFAESYYDADLTRSEGWDYFNDKLQGPTVDEGGNVKIDGDYNVVYPLGGKSVTIDNIVLRELGPRLAQSSDEEKVYLPR